jgi:hypothetical protein
MQTARPNFERWDFMEPVRRPSVLDPLMPRGLGTPLVESLASYVTRLAEAHVVSVWRLILHVLRPPHASRTPRSSIRYAYPVNGLGKVSEPFLRAFEIATQRADLQLLTLSVLDGCISQPGTFRTTEAWCPSVWNNGARRNCRSIALSFGRFRRSRCAQFTNVRWPIVAPIVNRGLRHSEQKHYRGNAPSVRNHSVPRTRRRSPLRRTIKTITCGPPRLSDNFWRRSPISRRVIFRRRFARTYADA